MNAKTAHAQAKKNRQEFDVIQANLNNALHQQASIKRCEQYQRIIVNVEREIAEKVYEGKFVLYTKFECYESVAALVVDELRERGYSVEEICDTNQEIYKNYGTEDNEEWPTEWLDKSSYVIRW